MNRPVAVIAALRMRDWVKNTLVLVPALVAGRVADPAMLTATAYAFLAFGLAASSAYVLNDICDRDTDRHHPAKRHRPFAMGTLPIATGVLLVPLLLSLAIAVARPLLPPVFISALGAYVALSVVYSLCIKRIAFADIVLLAGLYTMRVVGGAVACSLPVSPWLVACSLSGFVSLASLKRYAELQVLATGITRAPGRPYGIPDRALLQWIGVVAGGLCVLILILSRGTAWMPWVQAATGACLVYWMARSWFLARHGRMGADPLAFAVKDPDSYAVGAVVAAALFGRG